MRRCKGAPAERNALPYVEGTLPEAEVERFEEHYFDCPVCLAHLQTLQAAGQGLARQPIAIAEPAREQGVYPTISLGGSWHIWSAGALAALVLMSVFAYRLAVSRPPQPTAADKQPQLTPQTQPAAQPSSPAPVRASQLADLTLPIFIAPHLRGESSDAEFEAGMKEYANGNCRGAIGALKQVAADSSEAIAAQFYTGACQLHQGNLAAATGILRKVADGADSPQREAALYELAQIALAGNDAATAHAYLVRTIALQGDLERQSRVQDKRLMELTGEGWPSKVERSEAK